MRVTDEMVVAALNANQVKDFEQHGIKRKPEWGELEDWHPDDVERMRAAIEAALAVAPSRVERDAELIAEAKGYLSMRFTKYKPEHGLIRRLVAAYEDGVRGVS